MAAKEEGEGLSEEIFDVMCTICSRKNRAKEAKKYCTDCRKNLCADCVDIHTEHNESHVLADDFGEEDDPSLLTEKCGRHKHEIINLFCVDHDALICSVCALSNHGKCSDLKNITDSFKDLDSDPNIQGVPDELRSALQTADEMLTKLEQHAEALSEKENTFLEENEDYTTRLLAKIEELKRNAKTNVTIKHKQLLSEASEKSETVASVKKDIRKCLADAVNTDSRTAHHFILYKKGRSLIRNLEALCMVSEDMIKRSAFAFQSAVRIEECLGEFNALGECVERYKASSKVSISLSVARGSRSCDIQACCILPDATVLLLDDNKKRLKHVDPSTGCVKNESDLHGQLLGIDLINQHEVAVCTGQGGVQVICLVDKVTRKRKLKLKNKCCRIVYNKKELFIADDNCVYVSDLRGEVLRTIRENESGEDMFSYINGIAMNKIRDRLYVADATLGLICTDRNGQEMFRLSEMEMGLSVAHGVCNDNRGNVLVSGYLSNNVVQVTEEGRVIGEILSHANGIERPQCMCYDEDSRRLYVGSYTSNLLMYKLV